MCIHSKQYLFIDNNVSIDSNVFIYQISKDNSSFVEQFAGVAHGCFCYVTAAQHLCYLSHSLPLIQFSH